VEIEGAPVALAEVIDGYKNRDAPILPADVEMMKANLTAAQATMESKYEQQHLELAGVTKAVMDQLTHSQLSAEEMRQLERDDPQEYMLTQMRQRQTQDAVHSAVQALQAETQRQDGIEQQQTAEFQKAEMAKVPARIPEWKDRKIAAKEAEYIEEYLRTMDFADADFAVLNDSRYIAIARQAMLYAKLMDGKKLTMQKVKRTPKRVAQPARNENAQQEQVARQRQSVRDKLKKTGRIEDAAAAIGGLRQP
jgi:hypothetical protein